MRERLEPIVVSAGGDDLTVELARSVEVVIVVVEPRGGQAFGLRHGEHAEGHARLEP